MLKLNVGLARKIGEAGYCSRGGSINVEMELDSGLVAAPAKLQERIRHLFQVVRASLAEELVDPATAATKTAEPLPATLQPPPTSRPSAPPERNGARKATSAQLQAICAIARTKGVDPSDIAEHRFGVARPDKLTVCQASQLIDELRALPDPIQVEDEDVETVPF